MIQRMLAIWSLVPLPFLKPAWTSGSSRSHIAEAWLGEFWALFTSVRWVQLCGSLSILWHCLSLGLEWNFIVDRRCPKNAHSIHFSQDKSLCIFFYSFNSLYPEERPHLKFQVRNLEFPIPKKGNAKECSNYHTIALISHTRKAMFKILQARLQQYMNRELPDVQAGFRKGRGTRDRIANIQWIIEKTREFQKKHLFLLYWLCQNFIVYHNKLWKILKEMGYQTTWPASWEICMQVRK